jgi:hypothetical protein
MHKTSPSPRQVLLQSFQSPPESVQVSLLRMIDEAGSSGADRDMFCLIPRMIVMTMIPTNRMICHFFRARSVSCFFFRKNILISGGYRRYPLTPITSLRFLMPNFAQATWLAHRLHYTPQYLSMRSYRLPATPDTKSLNRVQMHLRCAT